jgi:hypothetical protein
MNRRRAFLRFAVLLAIGLGIAGKSAIAASPGFTITAGNVTMSADGSSSVTWTVTSVDGYSGTLQVACNPVNVPAGARLPICGGGGGPVPTYPLSANGVIQESFPLLAQPPPCDGPCPTSFHRPRKRFAAGLSLAGVLLIGLGFTRRRKGWLTLPALAVATLAGMTAITACGSNGPTLTPGVWPYTVSADAPGTPPIMTASATINVTVPAGIHGAGL